MRTFQLLMCGYLVTRAGQREGFLRRGILGDAHDDRVIFDPRYVVVVAHVRSSPVSFPLRGQSGNFFLVGIDAGIDVP